MRIVNGSLTGIAAMGLIALALGVNGCRSTPDRTATQVIADRQTARDVKKALAKAPVFKYPDVNATVYNGNVQLSGFVDSPAQRTQAAQIAATVKGVNQVINDLMIKPTPTGRATIRDPFSGMQTGRIMLDTNSPPSALPKAPLQAQPSQTVPNSSEDQAPPSGSEDHNHP
jgi:hypothetical protein